MYTNMSCQPTNLEKTTKVAGTTTAITAGLSAASTALSIKHLMKDADFNLGIAKDLKDEFVKFDQAKAKEILYDVPSKFKKIAEKGLKYVEKHKQQIIDNNDDLIRILENKKIDKTFVKNYGKQIAKSSLITGAVFGGVYLLGKTVVDHIKAKKAE